MLRWSRGWMVAGALTLSLASAITPAGEPDSLYLGRTGVDPPERTDAGDFSGTWFYVNRDWKIVLWIESQEGAPQIKLRFLSIATGESFETGWGGQSDYTFRSLEGRFSARVDHRDANTIDGTWEWVLGVTGARRIEHAKFSMYRMGDGRQMVFKFTDFERIYEDRPPRLYTELLVWTFRKASRRQALWAELGF